MSSLASWLPLACPPKGDSSRAAAASRAVGPVEDRDPRKGDEEQLLNLLPSKGPDEDKDAVPEESLRRATVRSLGERNLVRGGTCGRTRGVEEDKGRTEEHGLDELGVLEGKVEKGDSK